MTQFNGLRHRGYRGRCSTTPRCRRTGHRPDPHQRHRQHPGLSHLCPGCDGSAPPGPGLHRVRCGKGFRYVDAGGNAVTDEADAGPDRGAGAPSGLGGRLDLPDRARAPAGDRDRRGGPAAVPLPRPLAADPRPGEARADPRLRRGAPRRARAVCDGPGQRGTDPRAGAVLRRPAARPRASSGSAASSTPRRTRRSAWPPCARSTSASADGVVTFDYIAKSGKQRVQSLVEPEVGDVVAALKRRRGGGPELLAYRDGSGWVDVKSHDINAHLRELTGGDFTAKDFRTWSATVLAAVGLAVSTDAVVLRDGSQAGGHPGRAGGVPLPRQHPRRLPVELHRPADHRPVRRRASRSPRTSSCSARTPPTASPPPRERSKPRCSACCARPHARQRWRVERFSASYGVAPLGFGCEALRAPSSRPLSCWSRSAGSRAGSRAPDRADLARQPDPPVRRPERPAGTAAA